MDTRYTKLADLLVRHSTKLQKDEHVLIEAFDIPVEMTVALIRAVRAVGAHAQPARMGDWRIQEAPAHVALAGSRVGDTKPRGHERSPSL